MLHNILTDNHLSLFCLVDGEATTNAFPVEIESTKTIGDLKDLIKAKQSPDFDDIVANSLTLWRVSIPDDDDNDEHPILLDKVSEKKKLKATTKLSKVFDTELPEDTIHVIVQRPPQGDLQTDVKKITDKFFAPGPITNFLDVFVRGEKKLPVTSGLIRGLPRAWRHGFGKAPETRPSLLFLDLPDPSTPDSASRNLAARSILELAKENNRHHIPVFGVSGCGKTRAVIELLSQHWEFYFNASNDDWGSSDMMTLHSTVRDYLNDAIESSTADREANNAYARKTTLLLFLSRLLVFKYCLNVPSSSETFTSARWTLLQVCPHVLFDQDIFNILFLQLLNLRHHPTGHLLALIRNVYEEAKDCLIKHGCLPKIKGDTRLLVVHDEAQYLGDQFLDSFKSLSSDESPRPLLSPILHAFRDIGQHQLTLVTCGTGLSINTLFWVQSSGSDLKDSSKTFEYLEFPGWTDMDSIKTYVSRVRMCLQGDKSKQALSEHLPQSAIDLLFEKFAGRFRPAIVAVERIVECNDPAAWKAVIEDAEDKLVSWKHRSNKGNLCGEIERLGNKHNKYKDQLMESVDSVLGLLMYQRCMFGNHDLVLKEVNPALVEHAFGRIKIIR
ncbi:hypothetical protein BGX33_001959, partial [Mortierella sp. NVP41]